MTASAPHSSLFVKCCALLAAENVPGFVTVPVVTSFVYLFVAAVSVSCLMASHTAFLAKAGANSIAVAA
jgi:hypothetical protein